MTTTDRTFWEIVEAFGDLGERRSHVGDDADPIRPDPEAELPRPDAEPPQQDAERIASAAFCGVGLDPAVLSFATLRAAQHWGLDEDEIDLRIAAAIVRTASRLATEFAS